MPTCQLLFFPLYSLWEQIDAGVSPGLQNQCGAWIVPGGFDSHMFPPVNHIYFTAFQLSNAACQDSFLSIPAGKMLFVVAFQKSNGTLS